MNDLMDEMKATPYSILMIALTVVVMCGCGDNVNSKSAPSRWIRISLPAGVKRSSGGLTERDLNEIKQTIPTIERAVPERDTLVAISDGVTTRQVRLCATLSDMHHLLKDARAQITDGRFMSLQDGQDVRRFCSAIILELNTRSIQTSRYDGT